MKKSWGYYTGVRKFVFLYLGFLVLMEALALVFPMFLKNITEIINTSDATSAEVIKLGLLVFAVIVLIFIVNFLGEVFGAKAVAGYYKNLRAEMFERLQNAPIERINELGVNSILPLIMNDTAWLRKMQKNLMIFVVYFPVAILGSFIMLFNLQIYYGLISLTSLPIFFLFFFFNSRRLDKIMQKSLPAFDEMHTQVKEGIIGAKEIRLFNKSEARAKEFEQNYWYNRVQGAQTEKAINLSTSFTSVLFTFITVCIIIYGAYTMTDVTELVILNTAIQYINRLWTGAHYTFTLFVNYIPRVKLAKRRIAQIYNLPQERCTTVLKPEITGGANLEISGVSYKYPNGSDGLTNVKIKVDKNTRVSITGGAGSGRTIIPKMLLQYLTPDTGKITIDDIEINTINQPYYRRSLISFCDQTPEFIAGTVRENLRLLNQEVSDEEILKLFSDIDANAFIDKFGGGKSFLDFVIGERDGFNMATRKLLNLVRTLLKPAPIYVFNQCFDHINPKYIVNVMAKLKREKKTCIFITQNNQVSRYCDNVYVIKKGKVSGVGKHKDLIKSNADYREICFASESRIISDETTKQVNMHPEDPMQGGDAI